MDKKVKRRINILTYSLLAVLCGVAALSIIKLAGISETKSEEEEYYLQLKEDFTEYAGAGVPAGISDLTGKSLVPSSALSGNTAEKKNEADKTYNLSEELPGAVTDTESGTEEAEIQAESGDPADELPAKDVRWYDMLHVDLDGLKKRNDDVVGWIFLENEPAVSYPVVYSGDNEKYLNTGLDGQYLKSGTIFLEGRNSPSFDEFHEIIYGHNMKNDTMFGLLDNYVSDDGYLDGHRFFQLFTDEGVFRYRIIAFRKISPYDDFFSTGNVSGSRFKTFTDKYIIKDSMTKVDYEFNENDKLITLATCADGGTMRFIVTGVRVGEAKGASKLPAVARPSGEGNSF